MIKVENFPEESLSPHIQTLIKEEFIVGDSQYEVEHEYSSSYMGTDRRGENIPDQTCYKTHGSTLHEFKHDSEAVALQQFAYGRTLETSGRKYFCDVCKNEFTQSCDLSRHKLMHTGAEKYQCNISNKAFTQLVSLSQHKLNLSGIQNYQCDVKIRDLTCTSYISDDKLSHIDIKSYKCDICNKTFAEKRYLST